MLECTLRCFVCYVTPVSEGKLDGFGKGTVSKETMTYEMPPRRKAYESRVWEWEMLSRCSAEQTHLQGIKRRSNFEWPALVSLSFHLPLLCNPVEG